MKIAVIGSGISGLGSAYLLSKKYEVDLYEKETRLGGHARTTQIKEKNGTTFGVDTGFLVFNYQTYPLLTKLFKKLDIKIEKSDMSFGFWNTKTNVAYNGNSLKGIYFQKKNILSISHNRMIFDIIRFNKKANKDLEQNSKELNLTLKEYIKPYSKEFKNNYLIPMGACIWSTASNKMNDFPIYTFLNFLKNHGLLGITTHHQWLTVSNGSINYVNKISKEISGKIIKNSNLKSIKRENNKVILINDKNENIIYDKVIFAIHAPDVLKLLENPTKNERDILSCFEYKENSAILHNDNKALYPNKKIYAAWNYKTNNIQKEVTLSYYINKLQNLKSKKDYFVSLNEISNINNPIEKIQYSHPQFTQKAIQAQKRREEINGVDNIYYAGAYWRYGFHEDGLYSANTIAKKFGCDM